MTFLDEWLKDSKAPKYCALFGELGMGKTTTAKEFARRLWECRKQGHMEHELQGPAVCAYEHAAAADHGDKEARGVKGPALIVRKTFRWMFSRPPTKTPT